MSQSKKGNESKMIVACRPSISKAKVQPHQIISKLKLCYPDSQEGYEREQNSQGKLEMTVVQEERTPCKEEGEEDELESLLNGSSSQKKNPEVTSPENLKSLNKNEKLQINMKGAFMPMIPTLSANKMASFREQDQSVRQEVEYHKARFYQNRDKQSACNNEYYQMANLLNPSSSTDLPQSVKGKIPGQTSKLSRQEVVSSTHQISRKQYQPITSNIIREEDHPSNPATLSQVQGVSQSSSRSVTQMFGKMNLESQRALITKTDSNRFQKDFNEGGGGNNAPHENQKSTFTLKRSSDPYGSLYIQSNYTYSNQTQSPSSKQQCIGSQEHQKQQSPSKVKFAFTLSHNSSPKNQAQFLDARLPFQINPQESINHYPLNHPLIQPEKSAFQIVAPPRVMPQSTTSTYGKTFNFSLDIQQQDQSQATTAITKEIGLARVSQCQKMFAKGVERTTIMNKSGRSKKMNLNIETFESLGEELSQLNSENFFLSTNCTGQEESIIQGIQGKQHHNEMRYYQDFLNSVENHHPQLQQTNQNKQSRNNRIHQAKSEGIYGMNNVSAFTSLMMPLKMEKRRPAQCYEEANS